MSRKKQRELGGVGDGRNSIAVDSGYRYCTFLCKIKNHNAC